MTDAKPRTVSQMVQALCRAERMFTGWAPVLETWRRELLADVAAFVERQDDDCARCMAHRIRDKFNLPHPPEPEVKHGRV